jgi:hypothetical protein
MKNVLILFKILDLIAHILNSCALYTNISTLIHLQSLKFWYSVQFFNVKCVLNNY